MCLLFANAKPYLGLINYGGDRPVEVQGRSAAVAKQRERGMASDGAAKKRHHGRCGAAKH